MYQQNRNGLFSRSEYLKLLAADDASERRLKDDIIAMSVKDAKDRIPTISQAEVNEFIEQVKLRHDMQRYNS